MITEAQSTPEASHDEIRRSLALLHRPGDVFEIRCLDVPGRNGYTVTAAGYFSDYERAAEEIQRYDHAKGIYVTVNPCRPALLARADNRIVDRPRTATGDVEVFLGDRHSRDHEPRRHAGLA